MQENMTMTDTLKSVTLACAALVDLAAGSAHSARSLRMPDRDEHHPQVRVRMRAVLMIILATATLTAVGMYVTAFAPV
jgi:hypothetical protein